MIVARPRSSSFSGIVVWSVAAAKCGSGVRVHGGNGKTAESKSLVELWNLFVNQLQLIRYLRRRSHYFMLIVILRFNDGGKG